MEEEISTISELRHLQMGDLEPTPKRMDNSKSYRHLYTAILNARNSHDYLAINQRWLELMTAPLKSALARRMETGRCVSHLAPPPSPLSPPPSLHLVSLVSLFMWCEIQVAILYLE